MCVNDALLKHCEIYTGHRVESIYIFIKTTWSITSCQSETRNKTWTSIVLIFFVNYLAQSCVGSRQRNDIPRSIFCAKFCKLVTSILDLDLMNLSLKACAWFNPIIQGIEILIVNTSTTSHRDEWQGHTYVMHGKCNYEIDMRCPKNHHFLVNQCIRYHCSHDFQSFFKEKWVYNPNIVGL